MSREEGFTLIETMIASTLITIVVIGALLFISRANSRIVEYAEASRREEQQSHLASLFRSDFEVAGSKLVALPSSGKSVQESVEFLESTQTDVGTFEDTSSDPKPTKGTRGIFAPGWLQFKAPSKGGDIGFEGANLVRYLLRFTTRTIKENGKSKTLTTVSYSHAIVNRGDGKVIKEDLETLLPETKLGSKDLFRIAIEKSSDSQKVAIYHLVDGTRKRSIRDFNPTNDIEYPLQPFIDLSQSGKVEDITMNGPLVSGVLIGKTWLPADQTLEKEATLIDYSDIRGTKPRLSDFITITGKNDGAIILRGDTDTDSTYITQNWTKDTPTIQVKTPCRGTYRSGDIIMLIDGEAAPKRTALFRVMNSPNISYVDCENSLTTLYVQEVNRNSKAWNRFYSTDNDFKVTFRVRSMVAKLAPPIIYSLNEGKLERIEGERTSIAALGVKSFSVRDTTDGALAKYEISCNLLTDSAASKGDISADGYTTISYIATPAAINRKEEWQQPDPTPTP
jgi:type II secretory pathway pseudopilin PulG